MNVTKVARVSALALILFLITSLSAFAVPRCGCTLCQRVPERDCRNDGTVITCLEFLIVALCPPLPPPATSAEVPGSEAAFLASLSEPAQEPVGCLAK